jgi:hypothetical protein
LQMLWIIKNFYYVLQSFRFSLKICNYLQFCMYLCMYVWWKVGNDTLWGFYRDKSEEIILIFDILMNSILLCMWMFPQVICDKKFIKSAKNKIFHLKHSTRKYVPLIFASFFLWNNFWTFLKRIKFAH